MDDRRLHPYAHGPVRWAGRLAMVAVLVCTALSGGTAWAQPSSRQFYTENETPGLKHPVNGLAVDARNQVWAALSGGGLLRFDGMRWIEFTPQNSELPSLYVYDLAFDAADRVWLGTNRGAARFDGEKWEIFTQENTRGGLTSDWVFRLTVDTQGTVWFGTLGGGVCAFDGSNWRSYRQADTPALKADSIAVMAGGRAGSVLIGAAMRPGVTRHLGGIWNYLTIEAANQDPATVRMICSAEEAHGRLWVGTAYGLYRFEEEQWTGYANVHPLTRPIQTIALGNHGAVWVGTINHGLGRLEGDALILYSVYRDFNLDSDYVSSVAVAANGDVWFSGGSGLGVYRGADTPSLEPLNLRVDPGLTADPPTIPGPEQQERLVGVLVTPDGVRLELVENEVVLRVQSNAEAEARAGEWGGAVLSDGSIPDPDPQDLQYAREVPATDGYFLLRVQPGPFDSDKLAEQASRLGLGGTFSGSSQRVLELFALVLTERAQHRSEIGFNGVLRDRGCPRTNTQERPLDASAPNPALVNDGFANAFRQPCFSDSSIGLLEAWQTMEFYRDLHRTVRLCVIDRGFQLNDDFPWVSMYDFVDDDRRVDAHEAGYHGTAVLSLACAEWDNQFGSVGTGAPVCSPIAFRHDASFYTAARAIRTAVRWGAQVVNMSFGAEVGAWGWLSGELQLDSAVDFAFDQGVILVAAAGNDERDLGEIHDIPTEAGSSGKRPLVVGAIDLDTKRSIQRADGWSWGSNYGNEIDIWAPGAASVHAMIATPDPSNPDFRSFTGTSCAAPYAAGIIAMMRAVNPTLNVDRVKRIIRDTANGSPDARVSRGYVDAYRSVTTAALDPGGIHPWPDAQEPSSRRAPTLLDPGRYCGSVSPVDPDDGHWFYVDEIRLLGVDFERRLAFGGSVQTTLTGPTVAAGARLPFSGVVGPGTYGLDFVYSPHPPGPAFYAFVLSLGPPATIPADRFEVNDAIVAAGRLVFPPADIGGTISVYGLTLHRSGDHDYYELMLPALPDPLGYDERVTIYAEPDSLGTFTSFRITVYDERGADPFGRACNLEDIQERFPDRRIRFRVTDAEDRRNYYRLQIGYDRRLRGMAPTPPTFDLLLLPTWLQNVMAAHPLDLPWNRLDGTPMARRFPSAPEHVALLLSGQPPAALPPERLVMHWPVTEDLVLDIAYAGMPGDLQLGLIDAAGERLALAMEQPGRGKLAGPGKLAGRGKLAAPDEYVRRRLEVKGLPRGYYGLEVQAAVFPLDYELSFAPDAATWVAEEAARAYASALQPNIPNPFNTHTLLPFILERDTWLRLAVYNLLGQQVALVAEGWYAAGAHTVRWDGRLTEGPAAASGVYLYRLTAGDRTMTRKLLLLR